MHSAKDKYRQISQVAEDSIAADLGLKAGDLLLAIDGQEVKDIFDYRTRIMAEELTVLFQLTDGSQLEVEIEKDEEDDLGLTFVEPLLDPCTQCHNRCVFCFIDQMPKGMRSTLYFKDDDLRMSFLSGNYVTLTNLSDVEFQRLLSYHLSPMNVSVHATDPEVRKQLIGNSQAGNLMPRLRMILDRGISLNCQIVLCPTLNDGVILDNTLQDLFSLGQGVSSIAVVPVGLTKYREERRLPELIPYDYEKALALLEQVHNWQQVFLKAWGRRVLFAADEFYLRAERQIPAAEEYEEYPQLENGVGMLSDFSFQVQNHLKSRSNPEIEAVIRKNYWAITGVDAAEFLQKNLTDLSALYPFHMEVVPVENIFFGPLITVAGLLTGQDIFRELEKKKQSSGSKPEAVLIPDCCVKADTTLFLDDMTIEELEEKLDLTIVLVPASGADFIAWLGQEFRETDDSAFSKKGNGI